MSKKKKKIQKKNLMKIKHRDTQPANVFIRMFSFRSKLSLERLSVTRESQQRNSTVLNATPRYWAT